MRMCALTYPSQRSLIRQCVCDALLDAAVPYARDCNRCQPIIDPKCLGDSPSGFLDAERENCCPVYIAVYTDFADIGYESSQQCGRGTLNLIVELYVCDGKDYQREDIADEREEAVMIRLSRLSGSAGIQRVIGYESRNERDTDRIGQGVMLRQLTIKLEVVVDHSRPLCDPIPVGKPRFMFVEPTNPDCPPVHPDQ